MQNPNNSLMLALLLAAILPDDCEDDLGILFFDDDQIEGKKSEMALDDPANQWKMTGPWGVHAHQCPKCGTVWSHDPAMIPEGKNDEAHTCPNPGCGGVNFWCYRGTEGSTYHCGFEMDCGAITIDDLRRDR